jgi:hypothetical protein
MMSTGGKPDSLRMAFLGIVCHMGTMVLIPAIRVLSTSSISDLIDRMKALLLV